ncbi:hypothetical protein BRAO375_4940085 [Bradyrhizobium sp. ORS 375]|nr:hypothetical protein BRAO375_4940085 [Bradyrhizobium sp. ORS 375]
MIQAFLLAAGDSNGRPPIGNVLEGRPDRILLFMIHDDGERHIVSVEDHHVQLLLLTVNRDELRVMQLRMTVKRIPPFKVFNLSKVTLYCQHNIRMYGDFEKARALMAAPKPIAIATRRGELRDRSSFNN